MEIEGPGILAGPDQGPDHLEAPLGEPLVELLQVLDQVAPGVARRSLGQVGRAVAGDGCGDQVGLVPVAPVDGGPGHAGLAGHTLHAHSAVADLAELAEGGSGDGRADPFVPGPAPGRRALLAGQGRRGGTRPAHAADTSRTASTGGPACGTLGTKSRWRTSTNAPIEPMSAMTAPMAMMVLRVVEKPVR